MLMVYQDKNILRDLEQTPVTEIINSRKSVWKTGHPLQQTPQTAARLRRQVCQQLKEAEKGKHWNKKTTKTSNEDQVTSNKFIYSIRRRTRRTIHRLNKTKGKKRYSNEISTTTPKRVGENDSKVRKMLFRTMRREREDNRGGMNINHMYSIFFFSCF